MATASSSAPPRTRTAARRRISSSVASIVAGNGSGGTATTGRGVIRPPFVFVSSRIGPNSQEYRQLDTGPVAGFWVDDAAAARHELIEDGVDSCTLLERGPDGHGWFYFHAPDGNYYETCERAHPEGH